MSNLSNDILISNYILNKISAENNIKIMNIFDVVAKAELEGNTTLAEKNTCLSILLNKVVLHTLVQKRNEDTLKTSFKNFYTLYKSVNSSDKKERINKTLYKLVKFYGNEINTNITENDLIQAINSFNPNIEKELPNEPELEEPEELDDLFGDDEPEESDEPEELDDLFGDEPEEPELEEPEESTEKPSVDYFKRTINNSITSIKNIYTGLFSSGYSVIEQHGLIAKQGNSGSIAYLSGRQLKFEADAAINRIYNAYSDALRLKQSDSRNISWSEISSGYNYFPFKLIEYLFGRYVQENEADGNYEYHKHCNATTWKDYWDKEIESNLKNIIECIVKDFLDSTDETDPTELDNIITNEVLTKVILAVTPCIIVSEYTPGNIKIRFSDPNNLIDNIKLEKLKLLTLEAIGSTIIDKPTEAVSAVVRNNIKEIEVKIDPKLCGVLPLFATNALDKLIEQGQKVYWNNVIMGRAEDDSVYIANNPSLNGQFNLSFDSISALHISAGSRSGKGVMTLNILASAVASGIPVFYIDCKPDMASVLKHMTDGKMFVVNGSVYDSTFDPYGSFLNNGKGKVKAPEILLNKLSIEQWNGLQYMKAVHFCLQMSSIIGNLKIPEATSDSNMLTIVDELWQGQNGMANAFGKLVSTYNTEKEKGKKEENTEITKYIDELFKWRKTFRDDFSTARDIDLSGKQPLMIAIYQADVSSSAPGVTKTSASVFKEKGEEHSNQGNRTIYRSIASLGKTGLVGYNGQFPHALYDTTKGSKYLTVTDRYFAYTPDIEEEKAEVNLSKTQYFKPFLILNDTEREDAETSPVGTLKKNLEKANLNPESDFLYKFRQSDGSLDPAIGFVGYMEKLAAASGTNETYLDVLKKSYDLSNYVLNKIGYFEASGSSDVFDYLYDFRPEFLLSLQEIKDHLTNGTKIKVGADKALSNGIRNHVLGESTSNNNNTETSNYSQIQNETKHDQINTPSENIIRPNPVNVNSLKIVTTLELMNETKFNDTLLAAYYTKILKNKLLSNAFNYNDRSNNPNSLKEAAICLSNFHYISAVRGLQDFNGYINQLKMKIQSPVQTPGFKNHIAFEMLMAYSSGALMYDTMPDEDQIRSFLSKYNLVTTTRGHQSNSTQHEQVQNRQEETTNNTVISNTSTNMFIANNDGTYTCLNPTPMTKSNDPIRKEDIDNLKRLSTRVLASKNYNYQLLLTYYNKLWLRLLRQNAFDYHNREDRVGNGLKVACIGWGNTVYLSSIVYDINLQEIKSDLKQNALRGNNNAKYSLGIIESYETGSLPLDSMPSDKDLQNYKEYFDNTEISQQYNQQQQAQKEYMNRHFVPEKNEMHGQNQDLLNYMASIMTPEQISAVQERFNNMSDFERQDAVSPNIDFGHRQSFFGRDNDGNIELKPRNSQEVYALDAGTIADAYYSPKSIFKKMEKKMFESKNGISFEFKERWKHLLSCIELQVGNKSNLHTLEIEYNTIKANGIHINPNLITHVTAANYDLELRDIVLFKPLFKKFKLLKKLSIDEDTFLELINQYGGTTESFYDVFRENQNLQLIKVHYLNSDGQISEVIHSRSNINKTKDSLDEAVSVAKAKETLEHFTARKNPNISSKGPGYVMRVTNRIIDKTESSDYNKVGKSSLNKAKKYGGSLTQLFDDDSPKFKKMVKSTVGALFFGTIGATISAATLGWTVLTGGKYIKERIREKK